MGKAWGKRLLAATCFLIGGGTVILIPVLWPLGWKFYKDARAAEARAAKGDELLDRQLEQLDRGTDDA